MEYGFLALPDSEGVADFQPLLVGGDQRNVAAAGELLLDGARRHRGARLDPAVRSAVRKEQLKRARLCRAVGVISKSTISSDLEGIAAAWDSVVAMRHGERVRRRTAGAVRKRASGHKRRVRNTKWTFLGAVRSGWTALQRVGAGGKSRGKNHVGTTNRKLQCMMALAYLTSTAIVRNIPHIFQRPFGVALIACHDATPRLVSFGAMQAQCLDFARFPVRREDGRGWLAVPLATLRELRKMPRLSPKAGVVEIFAQTHTISWNQGEDGSAMCEDLIVPPCVLQTPTGSCIFAAMDERPVDLRHLSRSCKFFFFQEMSDSCRAGLRKQNATQVRVPANCWHISSVCCAHLVHLIVEQGTSEKNTIGDVHALAFVMQVSSHFNRTVAAGRELLRRHLILFEGLAPPQACKDHSTHVLERTLRRFVVSVRGRLDYSSVDGMSSLSAPRNASTVDNACAEVADMWNGDLTQAIPEHYCEAGHCIDREDAITKMLATAIHSGLLQGLRSTLPAKNRWGSCLENLALQGAGFLHHNFNGAAMSLAFGEWQDGDPGDEHDDDFRLTCRKKVWRLRHYVGDHERRATMIEILWCSEPIDWLWRRLQVADEQKNGWLDLLKPETNYFVNASSRFWDMLQEPAMDGHFSSLIRTFASNMPERLALMVRLGDRVLSIAAHLWWRLVKALDPEECWLVRLLVLVRPAFSELERLNATSEFFSNANECCLDAGSLKAGGFNKRTTQA